MNPRSFHNGKVELWAGDCMDVLREIPDNSIDAVVTDPPYHLTSIVKRFGKENSAPINNRDEKEGRNGPYHRASRGFMGKVWDGGDIAFTPELWAEVLRVLKPGGHMVAFSGCRTYHRMACAIEDAGFEIREMLSWNFGSGFPKSHSMRDIGRPELGTALKPAHEPVCLARKPLSEPTVAANVLRWGTGAINVDGCRIEAEQRPLIQSDRRLEHNTYGPGLGGSKAMGSISLGRFPANLILDGSPEVLAGFPETTSGALAPYTERHEKASSFQFSREKTYLSRANSGSSARFFYTAKAGKNDRISRTIESVSVKWISDQEQCQVLLPVDTEQLHRKGIVVSPSDISNEWNTFLSGSNITVLCQKASNCIIKTGTSSTTISQTWSWLTRLLTSACIPVANYEKANGSSLAENVEKLDPSLTITLGEMVSLPGASRAASGTQLKISVNVREHGHPTVKPVDLIAWLVRLICPKNGTVLDPFAGTGTTGAATFREGCRAVLIEREAEYLADIERRMELLLSGPDERARKLAKADPHESLPLFGAV